MTVNEMHIEFRVRTQNLGGTRKRNFLDEEIDILLNEATRRFVHTHVRPVEGSQKFATDVNSVYEINTLLTMYQGKTKLGGENICSGVLPYNIAYIIDDSAKVVYDCINKALPSNSKTVTYFDYEVIIPESTGLYKKVTLSIDGKNVFDIINTAGSSYQGLGSSEMVYMIEELIHEEMSKYFLIYIKNGKTYYRAEKATNIVISIDGSVLVLKESKVTVLQPSVTTSALIKKKDAGMRLVSPEVFSASATTPYYSTHRTSPLSRLNNGELEVLCKPSFTVPEVFLYYIKKFRRISLILNRNSDLPVTSHNLILDKAVELAKVWANSPDAAQNIEINKIQKL